MSDDLDAIRAKLRAELEAKMAQPRRQGVINAGDGDLSRLLEDNEWVIIDLWAPWCGPCKIFGPVFEAAEGKFGSRAAFVKINVDANPLTSQALGVQSIPTLMVFHKGQLVQRQSGAMPGTAFEQFLGRLLEA